jgi:hypothetical protein
MSAAPDYLGLVKLLPALRVFPDAIGETTITFEEAARIRSLGFAAEAGRWKVPPVPLDLVRDSPLLEHLSAGWDSRNAAPITVPQRQGERNNEVASGQVLKPAPTLQSSPSGSPAARQHTTETSQPVSLIHSLGQDPEPDRKLVEKALSKILAAVDRAGGKITRRRLQQKLWRYSAEVFNRALRAAVRHGCITLEMR